jgi:hypothetical protein
MDIGMPPCLTKVVRKSIESLYVSIQTIIS